MDGIGYFISRTESGSLKTWDGKKFVDHGKGVMVYGEIKEASDAAAQIKDASTLDVSVKHISELPWFIYHPEKCTSRCCTSSGGIELDQVNRHELFSKMNLRDLFERFSHARGRDFIVWKGADRATCMDCLKDFYQGKIDEWGRKIIIVDVKCPCCLEITGHDMRYLVHNTNCPKCGNVLTDDNRVNKVQFDINNYH